MSDLKIQGVVEMSSEGAERAFDRVADKAGQMSSRLEKEAGKAGKAVDSIADGAGKSADEFSRAEGKIVASIKRATTQLEQLGKTASQKLELRISERGLDPARFEPMLGKLRELELAQARATAGSAAMAAGYGGQFSNNVRNASFQIQDFAVQVNGGVDATKALAMQLPQMLVGFGTAGAVIGVVAALLPNLVQAFSNTAGASKTLGDAMSDFNKSTSAVGETVKKFDMQGLYEEFNKADAATKKSIVSQIEFQKAFIETQRVVAAKKFGESISGFTDDSQWGRLSKTFTSSAVTMTSGWSDIVASDLGIRGDLAKALIPALESVKRGTKDASEVFDQFGRKLLEGNPKAIELAKSLSEMAKTERDAASASDALTEAHMKMAGGHIQTRKEAEEAARGTKALAKEQAALAELLNTINAKDTGFDANYVKNVELLLGAYGKGKLSLEGFNEAFNRYVAMQPGAVAAKKAQTQAEEDYIKALSAAIDPLERQASNLERELMYYGMTESAIQNTLVARLEEARAIAAADGAYPEHLAYLDREIEARQRIATASSQKEFLDTNKRAVEASAREWEKFADDINRSLTDALFRAFESGNGFGKSFADTLGNTLKAALAKAMIQATITTGGSAANAGINALLGTSGANDGAGRNYLGLANNASSIYNLYSGGKAAYTAYTGTGALSSSEAGAAAWQYLQGGDWGTALGVYLKGLTGTSTTATTGAAAGSTTASTGAMGLSSALGYMAAIAVAFNLLTESKTRYLNTQITGTLGPNGLTNGMIGDEYKATGNLLNAGSRELEWRPLTGDKAAYDEFYMGMRYGNYRNNPDALQSAGYLGDNIDSYTLQRIPYTQAQIDDAFARYMADQDALDIRINRTGSGQTVAEELTQGAALKAAFEAIYKGAKDSLQKTADLFGDQSLGATLQNYVSEINIQTSGSIADAIGKYADGLIQGMGAAWLPTVESLRATTEVEGKKITETWTQTFQRLVTESAAVKDVFDLVGESLASLYGNNTDKILAASDAFVKLFGSIDAMASAINGYYENFYTAEEKRQRQIDQIRQRLSAGGLNFTNEQIGDASREVFRSVVESLDLTTSAGQSAFKALMDVQAAFASLTPELQAASSAAKALEAAAKSFDDAFASAKSATDSAYDALIASVDAEKSIYQARIEAARELSSEMKSLMDVLQSSIRDIVGDINPQKTAQQARAYISQVAASASAGGYMPDQQTLSANINAAMRGLGAENFSSLAEQRRAQLSLSSDLSTLSQEAFTRKVKADIEAAEAQKKSASLDDVLKSAKDQIDEMRGVNSGVKTVQQAIADMQKAIVDELKLTAISISTAILSSMSAGTIKPQDAIDQLKKQTQITPDAWNKIVTKTGTSSVFVSSGGAAIMDGTAYGTNGYVGSVGEAKSIIQNWFETQSPAEFANTVKSAGISGATLEEMFDLEKGYATVWAAANNLPKFAIGTNYVQKDMIAQIHEGEAIIPKAYNPWAGGADTTASEVRELRAEVSRLTEIIKENTAAAKRTANAVNGNPEAPLLVEMV